MIRTERQELLRCLTSWSLVPEEIKGNNGREFMQQARLLYKCHKTGKAVFGRPGGYKLIYQRVHFQDVVNEKLEKNWRASRNIGPEEQFLKETFEVYGIRPDAVSKVEPMRDGILITVSKDSLNFFGQGFIPYRTR